MNINELSINNLISHNGLICTVEIINGELNEIYFLGEDFYYSDKPENLEGVPLTEEVLLKFGFEKIITSDVFPTFFRNKINVNDGIVYVCGCGFLNHIKYAHQLQNVFFDFTNEELASTKANYNTKIPMKPKDYCQCDFPIIRNGEYCGNCGKDIEPPK